MLSRTRREEDATRIFDDESGDQSRNGSARNLFSSSPSNEEAGSMPLSGDEKPPSKAEE
jgi:hypothetical protein